MKFVGNNWSKETAHRFYSEIRTKIKTDEIRCGKKYWLPVRSLTTTMPEFFLLVDLQTLL